MVAYEEYISLLAQQVTQFFRTLTSNFHYCNRFESLLGTVAKEFSTKRKRSSVGDVNFEAESPASHQPLKKSKRYFMKPKGMIHEIFNYKLNG